MDFLKFEEDMDKSRIKQQDNVLEDFSIKYFGKKLSKLNKEENHEIDCFGIYGVHEWLNDYYNGENPPKFYD